MGRLAHLRPDRAEKTDMAMTRASANTMVDAAAPIFDALEDILRLDQPVRPSVRRRVRAANDEAIRTLRQLGAEDERLLAPDNARHLCNAIAQRHGVKPRFMLTMRELGEQLALEFASALMPSSVRARLITSAVHLERRRAQAEPLRRRGSDQRPDPRVEWVALTQAVLALASMAVGAILAARGRSSFGLALSIAAVAFLAFARATLAISTDRRARRFVSDAAVARAADSRSPDNGPAIDLRAPHT